MCKGVCMLMNTVPEEAVGIRSPGATGLHVVARNQAQAFCKSSKDS